MKFLHGERDGVYLLDKLGADHLRDCTATRPGNKDSGVSRGYSSVSFHAAQKLENLFGLPGFVALIILPDGFICRGIDHDRFDRGRADIQTNKKSLHYSLPQ